MRRLPELTAALVGAFLVVAMVTAPHADATSGYCDDSTCTSTVPPTTAPPTTAPTTDATTTTSTTTTSTTSTTVARSTTTSSSSTSSTTSVTPTTTCTEDMDCWDCETMGNGECGPTSTLPNTGDHTTLPATVAAIFLLSTGGTLVLLSARRRP